MQGTHQGGECEALTPVQYRCKWGMLDGSCRGTSKIQMRKGKTVEA